MKTTHEIIAAEHKATKAAQAGNHAASLRLWRHVAQCWQAKAERAASIGEPLIASMLANEVSRARHRADMQYNWIVCEGVA